MTTDIYQSSIGKMSDKGSKCRKFCPGSLILVKHGRSNKIVRTMRSHDRISADISVPMNQYRLSANSPLAPEVTELTLDSHSLQGVSCTEKFNSVGRGRGLEKI